VREAGILPLNYSRSVGTLNNSKDSCLRARPKSDSLRIPDSTAMLLAVDFKERTVAIRTGLPQKKTPQCPLKGSVARNDLC